MLYKIQRFLSRCETRNHSLWSFGAFNWTTRLTQNCPIQHKWFRKLIMSTMKYEEWNPMTFVWVSFFFFFLVWKLTLSQLPNVYAHYIASLVIVVASFLSWSLLWLLSSLVLPYYALWPNLIYTSFVEDFEIPIKSNKIFSLH